MNKIYFFTSILGIQILKTFDMLSHAKLLSNVFDHKKFKSAPICKMVCICFILLTLPFINSYSQQTSSPSEVSYSIDFVFTKEIRNNIDSVFALQYTFSKADFVKFAKLHLEDSQKSYSVDAQKPLDSDSIEIITNNQKVYMRFRKYNQYDIPVLMDGEDKAGKKSSLYLRRVGGNLSSGSDFKNEVRAIRESVNKQQGNQ